MSAEKENEFGDDFPAAPPPAARALPISTLLIVAGLAALVLLLALSY